MEKSGNCGKGEKKQHRNKTDKIRYESTGAYISYFPFYELYLLTSRFRLSLAILPYIMFYVYPFKKQKLKKIVCS